MIVAYLPWYPLHWCDKEGIELELHLRAGFLVLYQRAELATLSHLFLNNLDSLPKVVSVCRVELQIRG